MNPEKKKELMDRLYEIRLNALEEGDSSMIQSICELSRIVEVLVHECTN